MIEFNNDNKDFLNKKLIFLQNKLKDFEVAYLDVALELVEDEYSTEIVDGSLTESFYSICGEGAKIRSHIDFIKTCIDLTKIKIKDNKGDVWEMKNKILAFNLGIGNYYGHLIIRDNGKCFLGVINDTFIQVKEISAEIAEKLMIELDWVSEKNVEKDKDGKYFINWYK